MKMLGHRNIQNTLLYTQLVSFESDEFHSVRAATVQDAQKLVEAGFEYVAEFERAGRESVKEAQVTPYVCLRGAGGGT